MATKREGGWGVRALPLRKRTLKLYLSYIKKKVPFATKFKGAR